MSLQQLQKNHLVRIFNAAMQSGKIDEDEFAKWQVDASPKSWQNVQSVWFETGCSDALNWGFLKKQLLLFAKLDYTPLETLLFFLQLPSTGDTWLHKQTRDTQISVYATCEQWLLEENYNFSQGSWILLNIAIATQSMPTWRVSDYAYRINLDFNEALTTLNTYADLDVQDIKALAGTEILSKTMALCALNGNPRIVECIERALGPGAWITHVLSSPPDYVNIRYNDALQGMKHGSLDAWALREYFKPSATFETRFPAELEEYRDWAHQWWFICVLGPTQESALAMVRSITKEVRPNLSIDVPESMFEVAQ